MTEERPDEPRARRRLAQAETALARDPADLAARERVVRSRLDLAEALLADRRSGAAAACSDTALSEAEELQANFRGDVQAALLLADALSQRAAVLDELIADAEDAGIENPDAIPDHLPPDPSEIAACHQRCVEVLEPLVRHDQADPAVLTRLGQAHSRLAMALDDARATDAAFGHHRASLACAERLAALDPRDPKARAALALAHNVMGHHFGEHDQLADAVEHHERSRALNEELSREEPRNARWRVCLATDHENLCDVHARLGDAAKALRHAKDCVRIRKALCVRRDATVEHRSQLADAHRDVAELSLDTGDVDAGLAHYRTMLALLGELSEDHPDDDDFLFRLADGQLVLGYALEDRGRLRDALGIYESALRTDLRLMKLQPAEPRWQANAAHCHLCAALVLIDLGERERAVEHAEQGLEILERAVERHPQDRGLLADLSHFHNDLGAAYARHDEPQLAIAHYAASEVAETRLVRGKDTSADPVDAGADQDALANLAVTYDSLAALHERTGDLGSASRYGRLAVRTEERLCELDPESVDYQARLVQALLNLAHTDAERDELDEALRALWRAEKCAVRLCRLVPRNEQVAGLAAQVERALGEALRDTGDAARAEDFLRRSVTRLEELAARADEAPIWAVPRAESLEALGEFLLDLGRAPEARTHLDAAVDGRRMVVDLLPEDPGAARELARTLEYRAEADEALGEHAAALRARNEAARLLERFGEGP
jgi:tetratricopeptide (TPR) repeat protein